MAVNQCSLSPHIELEDLAVVNDRLHLSGSSTHRGVNSKGRVSGTAISDSRCADGVAATDSECHGAVTAESRTAARHGIALRRVDAVVTSTRVPKQTRASTGQAMHAERCTLH